MPVAPPGVKPSCQGIVSALYVLIGEEDDILRYIRVYLSLNGAAQK